MTRPPTSLPGIIAVALLATVAACSGDGADAVPSPADTSTTAVAGTSDAGSDEGTPAAPPTTDAPTTTTTTTTATTTEDDAAEDDAAEVDPDERPEIDMSEVDAIVASTVTERELNGAGLAIVHRDHGIVHEAYWGVFDADRISLVASSSKMITAGVLARLHDDGLLDLDAPIAEALEGLAEWGAARPDITTAQLLSNSSGLVGLGPDPAYAPYVCQFLPVGTLQDCAAQIFTTTADAGDVIPPDTEFRYGGGQWQVAGGVAEVVSGRSWAELIDGIYVEPCGLQGFGYNNHFTQFGPGGFLYPADFDGDLSRLAPTDNPNMEGGLYTTVPDYAQVLLMHLRDGRCEGGQVLSTDALARMHADRTGEVYGSDEAYGLGWWVDRETGRLTDPGAYGSVAWLDPATGHGGFLVVESLSFVGNQLALELYEPVARALAEAGSAP